MAIKSSRTQERLVQDIDTVGRSEHDHCLVPIKTIQFHQQLIERLISLVVTGYPHRTLATHSVNFVDKNNAGRGLARLVEKVAHPARTHPNKHLDKFRSAHAEERHSSLTSYRFCQQRFTGSWRANE